MLSQRRNISRRQSASEASSATLSTLSAFSWATCSAKRAHPSSAAAAERPRHSSTTAAVLSHKSRAACRISLSCLVRRSSKCSRRALKPLAVASKRAVKVSTAAEAAEPVGIRRANCSSMYSRKRSVTADAIPSKRSSWDPVAECLACRSAHSANETRRPSTSARMPSDQPATSASKAVRSAAARISARMVAAFMASSPAAAAIFKRRSTSARRSCCSESLCAFGPDAAASNADRRSSTRWMQP
mmetsp:Transcript_84817/g.245242  ORF Transcript_84817/g.245242 Transcript_84817/m.245242 type:complete len:244 (+) Transcript_84817:1947-2678(+)